MKSGQQTIRSESSFCLKCGAWKGQLGLEPHPSMFIEHMTMVCCEVKRLLKKSGSLYLNLGDTYFGGKGQSGRKDHNLEQRRAEGRTLQKREWTLMNRDAPQDLCKADGKWLQPKQKLMIPARVAISLQAEGWILRNDIIWHKPNHMPSSVKDRLTCAYEHIFHFVKARRYFYDLDAIRQPHKISSIRRVNQDLEVQHGGPKEQAYLNENIIPAGGDVKQISKIIKRLKLNIEKGKGKNPGDVLEAQPYSVQPRLKEFIEYRNLPSLKEIKDYLNLWRNKRGFTIEQVETQLNSQAPHHWFNAESYPTKEDWLRIKALLKFDDRYDKQMTEAFIKPSAKQNNPLGKNPSDIITYKGKFNGFNEEAEKFGSPRARTQRKSKGKNPSDIISPRKQPPSPQGLKRWEREKNIWEERFAQGGKNPSDFWSINTKPFPQAHFAVYPEAICERPIKSSCPPNGIVLDPMCGAGTTLVVAQKLGRRWIGIDLKAEYVEMAKKRLMKESQKLSAFNG